MDYFVIKLIINDYKYLYILKSLVSHSKRF